MSKRNLTIVKKEDNNETEVVGMKSKMSIKKKLLIGGGIAAGLLVGLMALGSKKGNDIVDTVDSDDGIDAEYETDEVENDEVENDNTEETNEEQNPEE